MKKAFVFPLFILLLLFCPGCLAEDDSCYVCAENGGPIGVWSAPSTKSELLGVLRFGETVTIIDTSGSTWSRIIYQDYDFSYVQTRFLTSSKPLSQPKVYLSATIHYGEFKNEYYPAQVSAKYIYVKYYWSPDTTTIDNVKRTLSFGEKMTVIASNGAWCQVYLESDRSSGYVQSKYISQDTGGL